MIRRHLLESTRTDRGQPCTDTPQLKQETPETDRGQPYMSHGILQVLEVWTNAHMMICSCLRSEPTKHVVMLCSIDALLQEPTKERLFWLSNSKGLRFSDLREVHMEEWLQASGF